MVAVEPEHCFFGLADSDLLFDVDELLGHIVDECCTEARGSVAFPFGVLFFADFGREGWIKLWVKFMAGVLPVVEADAVALVVCGCFDEVGGFPAVAGHGEAKVFDECALFGADLLCHFLGLFLLRPRAVAVVCDAQNYEAFFFGLVNSVNIFSSVARRSAMVGSSANFTGGGSPWSWFRRR